MFSLQGKAAVVTGAGRGIGRAIALAYAEQGADVVLTSRTEEELQEVAGLVRRSGRKAVVAPADVRDLSALRTVIDGCVGEFGKIDILVNNAGGAGGATGGAGLLIDVTEEGWDGIYQLNAKAPFFGILHAARYMRDSTIGGAIINILSIDGVTPAPKEALYGSAKAALASLTAALGVELGQYKIRVNAIAPGLVDTRLVRSALQTPDDRQYRASFYPINRIGQPEDIAAAAVFFASDEAGWVSGQTMLMAGGTPATSDLFRFLQEVNPLPESRRS
ncbi:MAG: hypothetical protein BZY88_12815 [SAR202 cluster bacterium Io17-Chloro-G9]|nr:MAG: hypothetical protein BZY88_12815 [SAR202 cluster bacterium Io17-Chloro-G9]